MPLLKSLRILAVCTLAGVFLADDAWAKQPMPCAGARFVVVDGARLGLQEGELAVDAILLGDGSVEIPGICPRVTARIKTKKRKGTTRIRATWHKKKACAGGRGKVILKGTVNRGCTRIVGTLRNRNAAPKQRKKRAFIASQSRCGDALLDAGAGEQCDPPGDLSQCASGGICSHSCACDTVSTLAEGRCGNGVVDGDEACDGEACCTATCELASATTVCRPASGACDREERCAGSSALCPADTVAPTGRECRASGGDCDVSEVCDGLGSACPPDALQPAGVECRATRGECDLAESCTGSDSTCPPDRKRTTTCRDSAGICDVPEACDGQTNECPPDAFAPASQECRTAAAPCDLPETCTGASSTCPIDARSTAVCRPATGPCDTPEICDGVGLLCPVDALAPTSTQCRAPAGDCDTGELCSGLDASCPPDAFRPAGAECRASHGTCDLAETCTGSDSTCPPDRKRTTTCRDSAGICDLPEACDGQTNECPPDAFAPASQECRTAAAPCDLPETCTGTSPTCPIDAKSTAVCRPAAGQCDTPEICDGVSNDCAPDILLPAQFECRPAVGECDLPEVCNGTSTTCPDDAKRAGVCRPAAGACDIPEVCDGIDALCPVDAVVRAGAQCRASIGDCDVAEVCDGLDTSCPPDEIQPAGAECRTAHGACDLAETCTGSTSTCPPDRKRTTGTVCRVGADTCDVPEACDGQLNDCPPDVVAPATQPCRAAVAPCDLPETCTGTSPTCPIDAKSTAVCRPAAGPCDAAESCDGKNNECAPDILLPAQHECRPPAGDCDLPEVCTGTSSTCPIDARSTAVCRPAAGPCDAAETCDGVSHECSPDVLRPAQHQCRPAVGACDLAEACTGESAVCPDDARSTAVCRPAISECDIPELCDGVGTDCPPEEPVGDCDPRPNIIFIMADDHPWSVYGFMKTLQDSGAFPVPTQHPKYPPIDTPNLDRLAARGAVFPVAASSQSTCIPSYNSALNGLYPWGQRGSNPEIPIPEHLAHEGYISYGFGKLWSSYDASGFTHGGVRDWDAPRVTIEPIWSFVDSRADDGRPWFLWYAPRLPHRGYRESEPWLHLFPHSLFEEQASTARKHYANVMLLDFWIGSLLDGLEERGLDENTLIVFMSDNGYLMSNSKNRHGENGVRTPILVSLPTRIPRNLVLPQMVHAVDILPTIMDYAGALPLSGIDGQSMRPNIDDPSLPGRSYLFTRFADQVHYLRTRDGLRFGGPPAKLRLFDLTVDPDEDEDLADHPEYAHRVPELRQALQDLDASVSGARN